MNDLVPHEPGIPAVLDPLFDPGCGRITMTMPQGLSVNEIIGLLAPHYSEERLENLRVTLVTDQSAWVVERQHWHSIRPKQGVTLLVRIIPGFSGFTALVTLAVQFASSTLATTLGTKLGLGQIGTAILSAGLSFLGALQIDSLIGKDKSDEQSERPSYSIAGFQNELRVASRVSNTTAFTTLTSRYWKRLPKSHQQVERRHAMTVSNGRW